MAGRDGLAWLSGADGPEGHRSYVLAEPTRIIERSFADGAWADAFDEMTKRDPLRAISNGPVPRYVGHIAYDATWASPPRGRARPRGRRSAEKTTLRFAEYDACLVFDSVRREVFLVADDVAAAERLLREPSEQVPLDFDVSDVSVTPSDAHETAIARALDYIARGEIYQVNLARQWQARFDGSHLGLFLAMRNASPTPLGFFQRLGDHALSACTMERFLSFDPSERSLDTRPIKGTIGTRGPGHEQAKRQLSADPKERAEHSMIVDLMRNDLGRIAETGSVEVIRPFAIEPYSKLLHMVSTVRARLPMNVPLGDVMRATFPPGSVTGAPKVRAVEIIDELEPFSRGAYCGALGFVGRRGELSLAVNIRCAEIEGSELRYRAGGGIVEASVPEREVAETELKARAFLDALST